MSTELKYIEELGREVSGRVLDIWEGRSGLPPGVEEQYRNLWRIEVGKEPKIEPCRFHGKATGETITCQPCGGRVRFKVYECSHPKLAGICTLEMADENVPDCERCHWKNRDPGEPELRELAPPSSVADFAKRLKTESIFDIWQYDHDLVRDAHIVILREAIANPLPVNVGSGRGIVMGVGGTLYFGCAFAAVSVLRAVGCTLPIEWWHLGPAELDPRMIREAASIGVVCIDALEVAERVSGGKPRILNGWELKPFSIAHSKFREVLYLDADNIVATDPTPLFDAPEYQRHGAAFWPDLPPPDRVEWVPATAWNNVGLEFRQEVDFESGQLIVDKERCSRELAVTVHINSHSDWYYKFVYGDKTTFHLAWRACGSDYAMPSREAGWDWPAIQQHDFRGALVFQHVCQGKTQLSGGDRLPLHCGDEALRSIHKLRASWHGGIWSAMDQTDEETAMMNRLVGEWQYIRKGFPGDPRRVIQFQKNGVIGVGSAACEQAWTVRNINGKPTIIITGEAHKGTRIGMMFLVETSADGIWRGNWQAHERGPVELVPPVQRDILPVWWSHREGTWDWAMFDSVVVHDEYRMAGRNLTGGAVLDLGAHTGTFAYISRRCGAPIIHCYEAFADNAIILDQNAVFIPGCTVFREALGSPGQSRFISCAVPANTGGGGIIPDLDGDVTTISLDTAIERLVAVSSDGRVRLLKLDIEGSEWAALEGARLDLVDEVIGEYHGDHNRLARLLPGFEIQAVDTAPNLGLFWAFRPNDVRRVEELRSQLPSLPQVLDHV